MVAHKTARGTHPSATLHTVPPCEHEWMHNYSHDAPHRKAFSPDAVDWGSRTGAIHGNCACETESLRRAEGARCRGWWWQKWQCHDARLQVIAYFAINRATNCD